MRKDLPKLTRQTFNSNHSTASKNSWSKNDILICFLYSKLNMYILH